MGSVLAAHWELGSNPEFEQRASKMRSSPPSTIPMNSKSSVVGRWSRTTRVAITPRCDAGGVELSQVHHRSCSGGQTFLRRTVRRGLHRTRRSTDHRMMGQAPYGSRSVALSNHPQRVRSIFGHCVAFAERGRGRRGPRDGVEIARQKRLGF